ncbi:MAG TPA: hypothetical protein VGZ47_13790, partial [Gemmataceae bacterium]|nr:hypothetical protein [Gemmataceae bacterium]
RSKRAERPLTPLRSVRGSDIYDRSMGDSADSGNELNLLFGEILHSIERFLGRQIGWLGTLDLQFFGGLTLLCHYKLRPHRSAFDLA